MCCISKITKNTKLHKSYVSHEQTHTSNGITATAIDHIITNLMIDTEFKAGIFKRCISGIFAIRQVGKKCVTNQNSKFTSKSSIESFKIVTTEVEWGNLESSSDSNLVYDEFIDTFTFLKNNCFLRVKIKEKA